MPQELYEEILRNAFSFISDKLIDRYGDPARLADTDEYFEENINRVKIGIGYAMEIFFNDLRERVVEDEVNRLNDFSRRLISSQTLNDVEQVMNDFNITVFNHYYQMKNGKINRV